MSICDKSREFTGAMKGKRPKNIHSLKSFKARSKLCLRKAESVPEMEAAIHIGIGEGNKEFRLI